MKLASMLSILVFVAPALADSGPPQMQLRVVPTKAGPVIEATIVHGPRLTIDQLFLMDEQHRRIPASALVPWTEMDEPVAIALVIAGSEVMMGNTSIEDDENARYPGYLGALKAGMTALDLAHTTPKGSQGVLITYEDAPHIRVPMGPIARLDADALGSEKDYYRRLGVDMVGGLELAISELAHVSAARKVLIVIGDGSDGNEAAAKNRLVDLQRRCQTERIETIGLIYKGALSSDDTVLTQMIEDTQIVPSADGMGPAMGALAVRLADRYLVRFPTDQLTFDGSPTYLTVDLGGRTIEPVQIYLGEASRPVVVPARYNPLRSWWFQLAMGLGVVGAAALVMRWRARRKRRAA